jgi:hypothetical protein
MPANSVPPNLARRVSPGLLMFTGASGIFMKCFGIALAVLGLYGTIVLHRGERPHHSGVLYLVGPWVFPEVVAACFALSPFRPYRGIVFIQKTQDIDPSDPVAMRLVELLKSQEARHQLRCQALQLSGILFALMLLPAFLLRGSLSWSFSPTDLGGVALGLMGSFIAMSSSYIGWAFKTWVEREARGEGRKP